MGQRIDIQSREWRDDYPIRQREYETLHDVRPTSLNDIYFPQWTDLPVNTGRPSVRIHSNRLITLPSLVILDVPHLPTGCASWPAFWLCGPNWPHGGEVDIVEAVNTGTLNQMTLHTGPGCKLKNPGVFSGTALGTDCESGTVEKGHEGCGILSSTQHSAGSGFNQDGGGVFVTAWLDGGISICEPVAV